MLILACFVRPGMTAIVCCSGCNFGGRNIFGPDRVANEGITYVGIGLGACVEPVQLDPFDGFIREPVGMALAQT